MPNKPGGFVPEHELPDVHGIDPETEAIVRDLVAKGKPLDKREEKIAEDLGLIEEKPPEDVEEAIKENPTKNPYEDKTFSRKEMTPFLDVKNKKKTKGLGKLEKAA